MAVFTAIGTAVATSVLGAAAAGTIGFTFIAGATAAALQIAAGVGLSLIGKSLAGQPQADGRPFSAQVKPRSGDTISRSLPFGWSVTGGSLAYYNMWGSANTYATQVFALYDLPVSELARVWIDDNPVTLLTGAEHADYGYPVSEYRKAGVDHLWVKFYDGTQTTADPFLVASVSSAEHPYTADRVGTGIPYIILTSRAPARADGEERPLFQGLPQGKYETYGYGLFDPTDEDHEAGDPSTWGGDGDFLPAVQLFNVMRGISYNGEWLYGLQSMTAARLPLDNWSLAIEKCRVAIEGPDGMEPTYRAGGEIVVNVPMRNTAEALMTAMQGRMTEVGGAYKLFVGEPDAAVFSFTDDDILSTEEQPFKPFFSLSDSISGIAATWPNPAEGWADKAAPTLLRQPMEARIRGRKALASVSLDLVPYGAQVQRLQLSALNEAERERTHTHVMGPEAWVLEPGDVVQWTSVRNGYTDKLFRILAMSDRENLDVLMTITEVDPSDYDWNQEADYTPQTDGPLILIPPPALVMSGWQVFPATIYDEDGDARRPSIEVRFASGLADVQSVRVQVRVDGETDPMFDGEVPYSAPFKVILAGQFSPNTAYEVRGIFVRQSLNESTWSAWIDVTTPNVKLIAGKDFDPFTGVTGFDQLADDLGGYQDWIGGTVRELLEEAEANATNTAGQELANSLMMQEMRREYGVVFQNLNASFEEVITVSIIPLNGQLVALADAVTSLSAGDGTDLDTARFRMTTLTGPTGYARIGAETRYDNTDGADWRGAAWYLDTPNNPLLPTRFLVDAEQILLIDSSDPDNVEAPFVFEDGEAKMVAARIGIVRAGRIESASGTSFWDLDTGAFRIST